MFEEDRIPTSAGELKMTFVGHGTLIFTFPAPVPLRVTEAGRRAGR